MISLKSAEELEKMRRAGRVVGLVLEEMKKKAVPGVTTGELDKAAETIIRDHKAVPTFLGYQGFPASICASVNEQVVHGIPGKRVLKEGDIIGIDVGATLDGFVGDAARTFAIGRVSAEDEKLMKVTREALEKGIAQAVDGNFAGDIGHAVQQHVEAAGYSVVRDFVGHGVGRKLHEQPQIPNYGEPGKGAKLRNGMTIAIEPMVDVGTWEVRVLGDNWTVVTKDGSRSAHFENSIAITENGPEILTRA